MKTKFAVPSISATDITKGKKYPISEETERTFVITDDDDFEIFCLKEGCGFLPGGEWEIIELNKTK